MNTLAATEGLTESEAAIQLQKFGLNELPQVKQETYWIKSSRLIKEPMILLLIATATIYFFLGDLAEAMLLGLSVFVVIGISLYQERKSERALAALRKLSSPRALVLRNSLEKRIAATELVPGDLIILHEGDRVPADGILLQCSNLSIDESLLTGESFPSKKMFMPDTLVDLHFDDLENHYKVFSSTLTVSGTALVRIVHTGSLTQVGKIGKSLQGIEPEQLNLSTEIRQIVRLFAWTGAIICGLIVLVFGLTRGDWIQAMLVGLATQMALLPEEFPVVLTIFMAMGAWRLSKINVLVRRPGSIERLGAVSALCVDKTGTLTRNEMTVSCLNNFKSSINVNSDSAKDLPEDFHEIIEFGVLAGHIDPYDPMEKAICSLLRKAPWKEDHLHQEWELIRDYPLSKNLLAMSCVWKSNKKKENYVIASKGAPEAIIDLCHLDRIKAEQILHSVKEMAQTGLRVLGVARAFFPQVQLPNEQHDFEFEWIGLIGLEDPLRPEVPDAIEVCRKAGIRVIMMTGDYPETALKIAKQAGIDTTSGTILGAEIIKSTDQELRERLKSAHIFARMIPEHKLRIVKALKEMGHVVAMTGDGVNDAPSLKWADIGIAMGARGTDVARESSDIVLLDDHFASIVAGIKRGRIIFSNIKKAMGYIVSIHVPIAGLAILPVLFGWPLILLPAHIVFLELIIDPVCSLMFESQEVTRNVMDSSPRHLDSRLFTLRDLIRSFAQGSFILIVIVTVFWILVSAENSDPTRARTLTFTILILSNIGLIFADLSGGSARALRMLFQKTSNKLIVLSITSLLLIGIQTSQIHGLFHFKPLTWLELAIAACTALVVSATLISWNWIAEYKRTNHREKYERINNASLGVHRPWKNRIS